MSGDGGVVLYATSSDIRFALLRSHSSRIETHDESSGNVYFYHSKTLETVWQRPDGVVVLESELEIAADYEVDAGGYDPYPEVVPDAMAAPYTTTAIIPSAFPPVPKSVASTPFTLGGGSLVRS